MFHARCFTRGVGQGDVISVLAWCRGAGGGTQRGLPAPGLPPRPLCLLAARTGRTLLGAPRTSSVHNLLVVPPSLPGGSLGSPSSARAGTASDPFPASRLRRQRAQPSSAPEERAAFRRAAPFPLPKRPPPCRRLITRVAQGGAQVNAPRVFQSWGLPHSARDPQRGQPKTCPALAPRRTAPSPGWRAALGAAFRVPSPPHPLWRPQGGEPPRAPARARACRSSYQSCSAAPRGPAPGLAAAARSLALPRLRPRWVHGVSTDSVGASHAPLTVTNHPTHGPLGRGRRAGASLTLTLNPKP
jgi:hypothetical protein